MRLYKVLVIGNGPYLNNVSDECLESYDITIGCNYIFHRGFPDYWAVTDLHVFFDDVGWNLLTEYKGTWLFPEEARGIFKPNLIDRLNIVFIKVPKRIYSTIWDLSIPFALAINKEIDLVGVTGEGHFYKSDIKLNTPKNCLDDLLKIYKKRGYKLNLLDENDFVLC